MLGANENRDVQMLVSAGQAGTLSLRALLAIVTLAALSAGCRESEKKASEKPLKVFETAGWDGENVLLVRMEGDRRGRFLLSYIGSTELYNLESAGKKVEDVRPWRPPVYRYDAQKDVLEEVDAGAWTKAETEVSRRGKQNAESGSPVVVNSNQVKVDGRATIIATRGKYALASCGHKRRGLVAVLSADGPATDSILPFVGRLKPRGQHYHELLGLPGLERVGEAVPIPLKSDKHSLRLCWSPDGRFVLYYESSFRRVCIIPIEPQEREKP
jgi:hypothetical protein